MMLEISNVLFAVCSFIIIWFLAIISHFVAQFGYKQDDIVMLTDDARNPRQIPTRENIVSGACFYSNYLHGRS